MTVRDGRPVGGPRPPAGAGHPAVAVAALVGVTATWGSTFFMLKGVVTRLPAADFLALRFAIAGVALWAVAPRSIGWLSRTARRHGLLLGVAYGTGQLLQTWGLEHTSASVSGFVTGMYVILSAT